jgi:folate-binding protein YgfZ
MAEVPVAALDPSAPDAGAIAHHGDPVREQRTLTGGAGLVDRSHRAVLRITGADRLTFLHSLTSQHLTTLRPWQGTETLVLSPHGHVEHHAVLTEDGEACWLDVEPGTGAALIDFLTRMRFMMRVEIADVSPDWALLCLVGPAADGVVGGLGAEPLPAPHTTPVPPAKFASAEVPKVPTTLYAAAALPGGGWLRRMAYGYDLLVPRADAGGVAGRLSVPPAGIWAFEALRVARRAPRFGLETDHRTIPAEVGWLGAAVHLDKGCYRGQETVARVHNLGRPPRRLVLLHLDGVATDQPPAPHTPVTTVDGREVGFVGTAVRHHELGMIALAVLKRTVPDGAELRVGPSAAAIDPSDPAAPGT